MASYNGVYYKKKCNYSPLQASSNGSDYYPLRVSYADILAVICSQLLISALIFYLLAGNKRYLRLQITQFCKGAKYV